MNNIEAQLSHIHVNVLKKIGGGGQAKVYECKIQEHNGNQKYATKIRKT